MINSLRQKLASNRTIVDVNSVHVTLSQLGRHSQNRCTAELRDWGFTSIVIVFRC